jgi:alanine racemase
MMDLEQLRALALHGEPCAIINQSALRQNLTLARSTAPRSKVLAVIKANAYGHGIVPVARALSDADAFGVARLKEALALRDAGIVNPIVLLEGVYSQHDLELCARLQLQPVVHSFEQLQSLEQWNSNAKLTVWCKVDTGMNRLGFSMDTFSSAWSRLSRLPHVEQLIAMTHLADADDRQDLRTPAQLTRFKQLTDSLNVERSVSNSAGLLAWHESHMEWVRPGLMLYGMSPFADTDATQLGLRPVMTLIAPLIAIRQLEVGDEVGYGGTWRAQRKSCVGIVAGGYADGYSRHARSGTPVCVAGRYAPLIGRVSMDMIAVDLTDVIRTGHQLQVKIGDPVVLWGESLPVEQVAMHAGTIPYELVCAISQRVAIKYI